VDFDSIENYRNRSKRWRDVVTKYLTGGVSTSSQKYQDNIFDTNAVPPEAIKVLSTINTKHEGVVEKYIYSLFGEKQGKIFVLHDYITKSSTSSFQLRKFTDLFFSDPGLKRSIDKAYEIAVYSLFESLVKHLRAEVSLSVPPESLDLVKEFKDFSKILLGIDESNLSISKPAALFRAGATNAADRGLDIWANFGPAIQVKHITLNKDAANNMIEEIRAAKIVIVCKEAEEKIITSILEQVGMGASVQGVITEKMLEEWYEKALRGKYSQGVGKDLLKLLSLEFEAEFPSIDNFKKFYSVERGYDKAKDLHEVVQ